MKEKDGIAFAAGEKLAGKEYKVDESSSDREIAMLAEGIMKNDSQNIEQMGIMRCIVDSQYLIAVIVHVIMFGIFLRWIFYANYYLLMDVDA